MPAEQAPSTQGAKKTAVLLLTLGEQFAAEIFKRMERQELAAVSKAMVEMDTVPKELVEEVLREYYHAMVTGREMIRGGQDAVRRLLLP
ncbi:MAG: flagellar motor switch protein FliG, partial [Deltaproteobacteria bacterium]|nr:flagellar motor switch protein FliG [Deltaproteobacteria bacterium]